MKRRRQLILSLPNKIDPDIDEIAIDYKWSSVQEKEKDIALANCIENYKKQADKEVFQKSNWRIVWWLRYRT